MDQLHESASLDESHFTAVSKQFRLSLPLLAFMACATWLIWFWLGASTTLLPANAAAAAPVATVHGSEKVTPANQSSQAPFTSLTSLTTPTPPACGLAWRVVNSPNPSNSNNPVGDVAAVSSNDVWMVGVYDDSNLIGRVLIMHWDGSQWSLMEGPNPGTTTSNLAGLDTLASNDVWAVGYYRSGPGSSTLVEHWDGTQWSVVPSPDPNPGEGNVLRAVAATAPNDVWAVGDFIVNNGGIGTYRTLIEHWDGTQWSVVPSPNVGSHHNSLWDVAAVSSNDVWAVGLYIDDVTGVRQTLTLHWDGVEWTHVPSPSPGYNNILRGVFAVSSNDVWAVGGRGNQTLVLHWDGTEWSVVPSPNPNVLNELYGVAATDADDVWAVGNHCCNGDWSRTLVMHWDGAEWSVVPSPSPGQILSILSDVAAISSTDVWAVGQYKICDGCGGYRTLTERYSDPCTGATPSPTSAVVTPTPTLPPTSTPKLTSIATATSTSTPTRTTTVNLTTTATSTVATTSTPATATPPTVIATASSTPTAIVTTIATATPTICPVQFDDVPPDHTFYPYIMCLACRGIISGYSDGTFRPGNNVTRGQLSKIVSNSAGYTEDPGEQRFEDVPPTNTFYEWIQRLAGRGHIGGYECGGPGEPCISGKPYFRPNANATRGQISKIVSNAAQYNDPPGEQIFEDVPPTHTFYEWIQRLASRGIMSGYPCGSVGEPCISGKPYFRPQNNATRGQNSKIVSNTFFPECQAP
jgi:hypothetical protein